MHQITSGETHKKEIKIDIRGRKSIEDSLIKETVKFDNVWDSKSCLYDSFIIENPVFNYVNENFYENKTDQVIKKLLVNEFDELERMYPYLGDLFFLSYYKKLKKRRFKSFLFRRNNVNQFKKSLKNEISNNIFSKILDNTSLDYVINVKYKKVSQVTIEKNNSLFFDADYDISYINNLSYDIKNYKYVIIEGIVETIGEIHHLLHNASQNKEDYVIFCLGTSQEVKETILHNNRLGITKVHVVCFNSSEENLNVLNDIAVIHEGSDVISAAKGQTISQETKKGLSKGKLIKFEKNGFSIQPTSSEMEIVSHRRFLKERIESSGNEKNRELLVKRFKKFQSKKINIYLPEPIKKNVSLAREINYVMIFLTNLNKEMCKVSIGNDVFFIPAQFIKILENKLNNIKKIINNLECLITLKQKE